jgi:hypothetical protein
MDVIDNLLLDQPIEHLTSGLRALGRRLISVAAAAAER